MFENTTPFTETETYDSQSAGVFSEAVNFAAQFGVISIGSLLVIWGLAWPVYWLAPAAGLAGAIGLAVLSARQYAPAPSSPGKQNKVNLVIDVSEKRGPLRRSLYRDVFEGCRPTHLWRLANAHLNHGIPITRRPMMRQGVSQGQFELIRERLLSGGWANLESDYSNAPAIPNWKGRAILKAILAEFPTLPDA